ncbi:piggyBac transposable element-derived protein 4-like [Centruroides sculpturatus]|uniref:piggyBac transposable element-derived protein 4-like n=1 Tax=Centruroides sculpturatus TaxID=218467 RepID=UPI000C6DFBF9|nr:piggyBac transposable element-derived protein 4-like [Centruroides sculpturatus]
MSEQSQMSDSEIEYSDQMSIASESDFDLSSFEDGDDLHSEKDVTSPSPSSLSSFEDDYEPEDDVASPSSSAAHSDSDDEMEDEDYREVFSPEEPYPFPFIFQEESGPKHMPPPDSPPIAYFYLFFTSTLLSLMVEETNRYAQQVINGMGNNVPSYLKDWTKVSVPEMKGFLACILNMGLIKKPTIASYWSTSPSLATPWFGKMFSRHRFYHLLRFFHLVDNTKLPSLGESGYDPIAKYQPLVDHANRVFRHHYTPHQEMSVDESLMGTSLMQYIPNKHQRWGIKFWMLCDSVSNYCLGFFSFKRDKSQQEKHSISKFGLGYTVVRKLLEIGMYLNKGYHVFVDRYFTSVPLVRHMYSLQTYITGTVRRNHKMLPQQFKKKFAAGQTSYFRSGPVLAYGFRQKQSQKNPVFLLSSHAWARDVEVIWNGEAKLKPEIIQNYNEFIGGVDTSDVMLYAYLDERRTVKYWKKVAFNIIARMVLNSYILYKENFAGPGKVKSRFSYNVAVIESLEEEFKAWNLIINNPEEPKG